HAFLRELKEGALSPLPASVIPAWDQESQLRRLTREKGKDAKIQNLLEEFSRDLPGDLKLSFASRSDVRRWSQKKESTVFPASSGGLMPILEDLTELNLILLKEDDMESLLSRVMEAAVAFTEAEKGYLLLKSDATDGPLPGFRIVIAKN